MRVDASGENDHSAMSFTYPTGGGCLLGTTDDQLAEVNEKQGAAMARAEMAAIKPALSGSAALMRSALGAGAK